MNRVPSWLASCTGLFVIAVALLVLAGWALFGDHTRFARGFSEAKFGMVSVGMTRTEVERLLGRPLSVGVAEDIRHQVKIASGALVPVAVSYNEDGCVERAEGEVAKKRGLDKSLTRQDAEGALHTGNGKLLGKREYWHYADCSWCFSFQRWDVEFDRRGRVIETHGFRM